MTEGRGFEDWMRAWQSLPDTALANPWLAALGHFAQINRDGGAAPGAEIFAKLTTQCRGFFELGQQLASDESGDWQQAVFKFLDELAAGLDNPDSAPGILTGMPPLDCWHRFTRQGGGDTSDPGSLFVMLEQLLQTPAPGWAREHQQTAEALRRCWTDYQQAHGEYLAYCMESARIAAERLRQRFAEQFEAGTGPSSVRELYNAWVACSEAVHAERAGSEEYIERHGRLVNSFMAYRQQVTRFMDQLAAALSLPTRAEVDALHRKVKVLRQEVRALQANTGEKAAEPR